MTRRWGLILVAGLLVPSAVILSIWWPVAAKYFVWNRGVSVAEVDRLREEPSDAVLAEIGQQSLAVPLRLHDRSSLLGAAESVLRGTLELPGYPAVRLGVPFKVGDLSRQGDTLGLYLGSLADVHVLLDAYALSKRESFLDAAVARYLDFVEAERNAWLPVGFLWNDHAIAARIALSARLWAITRHHPNHGLKIGKPLLIHVSRSIQMLASPAQFTFATNHGVMQNVALLQAAAAFPGLSGSRAMGELGRDRLDAQLGFYLSGEGMVLEHSAGYHKHGVEFLAMAIRSAELAGIATPDWKPKLANARQLLDVFRRSDGSLPRFGNTFGTPDPGEDQSHLPGNAPHDGLVVLPVSGYALWRNSAATSCGGQGTHLAFAASYFRGHGHKLADEGSLSLWAGGRAWIDNTGYWPYGYPGRIEVDGWRGSNAPHLVDEGLDKGRLAILTHALDDGQLQFFAFVRQGPNSPEISRQVVGIDGLTWLVIDAAHQSGLNQRVESLWTFDPGLDVTPVGGERGGGTALAGDDCVLDFRVPANRPTTETRVMEGQHSPFGGWMMKNWVPTPAPAIEVRSVGSGAVLIAIRGKGMQPAALGEFDVESDDVWQATLTQPTGRNVRLLRKKDRLSLITAEGSHEIYLPRLVATERQRADIQRSFSALALEYPPTRDYLPWRVAATQWLVLAALATLIGLALITWRRPNATLPVSVLAVAVWIVEALWMHVVYFA